MAIDIEQQEVDGLVTLSIGGNLDEATATSLSPYVEALVEKKHTRVDVNLAGLEHIDSVGVAALAGLYQRMRHLGGEVRVIEARDQPLAILRLLRMDKVFLH